MKQYIGGDWPTAHRLLMDCIDMTKAPDGSGGDGPSHTLARYLAARGMKAPDDWKGYRELMSK